MKNMKNTFFKILLPVLAIVMMISLVLVTTGCDKVTTKISELTGVKYENGKITWDKFSSAKEYEVVVDGNVAQTVTDNSYTLTDTDNVESIEIKAKDENGDVVAEGSFYILPLMVVEVLDGNFDWTQSSYELDKYVNEGYKVTYEIVYDGELKDSKYGKTTYPVGSGEHRMKVRGILTNTPVNVAFFSNYSEEATSKVLAVPTDVKVERGLLSWAAVDFMGAPINYRVVINGVAHENVTTNHVPLNTENITDVVKVSVQSISTQEGMISSAPTKEYTFKQVEQIKNVKFEEGVLTWDTITGAVGYRIEINGVVLDKILPEAKYEDLVAGDPVTVRVRAEAEADVTYGYWSDVTTVLMNNSPILRFDGSILLWDSVVAAENYTMVITRSIDGELQTESAKVVTTTGNVLDISQYCVEVGEYQVKVKANPLAGSEYRGSRYSDPKTVIRLGSPTQFNVTETVAGSPGGSVQVTIRDASAGAKYSLYIDGTLHSSTTSNVFTLPKPIVSFVDGLAREVEIKIMSEPQSRSENNGKIYLPATQDDCLLFYFDQLKAPQNVYLTTNDGKSELKWEKNEHALGYGIECGATYPSTTNSFVLPKMTPGVYELKVFAKGDCLADMFDKGTSLMEADESAPYGIDVEKTDTPAHIRLSSVYSYTITAIKLAAPVDFEVDNGLFKWDDSQGATGYKCIYSTTGENSQPYEYNPGVEGFDGIYKNHYAPINPEIISTQGFLFNIKAIGNAIAEGADQDSANIQAQKTIILDSDWSNITWKSVMKRLQTPTGLKFSDTNLSWNPVDNASYYKVISGANALVTTTTNQSINLDALNTTPGVHTYKIQAIGDGEKYFDSAESVTITVTRLKQPVVTTQENGKCYVWDFETGVDTYEIIIRGGTITNKKEISTKGLQEGDKVYFEPDFNGLSNPEVVIHTNANEKENYMDAKPVSFTQTTKTLAAPVNPEITCKIKPETHSLIIGTKVENTLGTGFVFEIAKIRYETKGNEKELEYKVTSAGSIDIKVGFKANIFHTEDNGDVVYYLNSDMSSENTKTVYVCGNTTIETTMYPSRGDETTTCTFKWTEVEKAQFKVSYEIYDAEGKVVTGVGETIYVGNRDKQCNFEIDNKYFVGNDGDADTHYKLVLTIVSIGNDMCTSGLATIISSEGVSYEFDLSII